MEELSRKAAEYFLDTEDENYLKIKNYNLCFGDFFITREEGDGCILSFTSVALGMMIVLGVLLEGKKTLLSLIVINLGMVLIGIGVTVMCILYRKLNPKFDNGIPLIVVFWIVEMKIEDDFSFGNEFYDEKRKEILQIMGECHSKIKNLKIIKEDTHFFGEKMESVNSICERHLILSTIRKNKFPHLISEIERVYFALDALKEFGFGLSELTYLLLNSVILEHSLKLYRNERD